MTIIYGHATITMEVKMSSSLGTELITMMMALKAVINTVSKCTVYNQNDHFNTSVFSL